MGPRKCKVKFVMYSSRLMYCVTTNFLTSQMGRDHLEEELVADHKGKLFQLLWYQLKETNGAWYLKEDRLHS